MGVALSLIVIAAGAILTFAVDVTTTGVSLTAVGWILMAAGLVGLVLSIAMWESVFGVPRRREIHGEERWRDDAPTRRF